MARGVIALIAVASALACGARSADEKDPVKDKLFAAKVAYDKEMQQFRAQAGDWLDKREEVARKDGNKKALDQIKVERKTFDETGELPKTAAAALKQKPVLAKKALEAAYGQAVKDYVKAKRDAEAAAVEDEWKAFTERNVVDLLALVDLKAHAIAGEWKRDKKAIACAAGKLAKLQFPYEPGEEYDLEVKCRRSEGTEGIWLGLVAGGRPVLAMIDGWSASGSATGLDLVDEKAAFHNVTTVKGPQLKNDTETTIICSVRNGKIDMSINGKAVVSFKGDFERLSIRKEWSAPNEKALFLIVGEQAAVQFDRIAVTPVKGRGAILK